MSRGIIWDWGVPRTIQGYWDMGRITIPPVPQNIILTDRDTGTKWLVKHNTAVFSADNLGYISITDTIPTQPDKLVYLAGEEPFVSPNVRLIVRSGVLGYDFQPLPPDITDQEQAPYYIRTLLLQSVVKIILGSTFALPGDPIAFTVLTLP